MESEAAASQTDNMQRIIMIILGVVTLAIAPAAASINIGSRLLLHSESPLYIISLHSLLVHMVFRIASRRTESYICIREERKTVFGA